MAQWIQTALLILISVGQIVYWIGKWVGNSDSETATTKREFEQYKTETDRWILEIRSRLHDLSNKMTVIKEEIAKEAVTQREFDRVLEEVTGLWKELRTLEIRVLDKRR